MTPMLHKNLQPDAQSVADGHEVLLGGSGGLVSRLRIPITHMITLIILIIKQLTKSPWPSK